MIKIHFIKSFIIALSIVGIITSTEDANIKDAEDVPSQWPGHLEPFGSKQKTVGIEVFTEWPSPKEFFQKFLDASRPALFKGLGKRSPAYKLWDDDYLANHPGSDTEQVYTEPEKKEDRKKEGKYVSFKNFIEIYHNESIYMVHGVPENVRKDVLIPPPLRCEETKRYLLDAVTWFSSGGTKSVIHHDDLDNINCLFRGSKKLLFIEPTKNDNFLYMENGYSSVDVEKVDYTKYPLLRNIDQYIEVTMEAGDCLFIPFKWYHQVNSFANEKGQNVAVNIWFKHTNGHQPQKCDIPEHEATIDKYKFSELEKIKKQKENPDAALEEEEGYEPNLVEIYEGYLKSTKKNRANFKTFFSLLKRDPYLTEYDLTQVEFTPHFIKVARQLFNVLDITKNGILNVEDFDKGDTEENREAYQGSVSEKHEILTKYLASYIKSIKDSTKQDIPMKNIEEEVVEEEEYVERDEL